MKKSATVVLDNLAVPESLRWHEGALWFSDLALGTVHRWPGTGDLETVVAVPGRACGLGWLPDGRLLVVSMDERRVYRLEADGSLVVHADLSHIAGGDLNDMVVAPNGRAYVGNFGFDYHEFNRNNPNSALYAPPGPPLTPIVCLDPDGTIADTSRPTYFPNGAVLTKNGKSLIVAETMAMRLTEFDLQANGRFGGSRTWAPLISGPLWKMINDPGPLGTVTRRVSAALDHPEISKRSASPIAPDGIAWHYDNETIWVANALRGECVRVERGGQIRERVVTSQNTLCCLVGGDSTFGHHLFAATVPTDDPVVARELRTGRIEVCIV